MRLSDVKYLREAIGNSYDEGSISQSENDALMNLLNEFLDLEEYCYKTEKANSDLHEIIYKLNAEK